MSTPTSDRPIDLVPAAPVRPMRIAASAGAGTAILTDAETRAAEQALFDAGTGQWALMRQAGEAAAAIVARRFPGADVLVACGPGNNGGDGYVVAAMLRDAGFAVRVAALAEPRTDAARQARARWNGPVEPIGGTLAPADVLVDAVFGCGQSRAVDPALAAWLAAAGRQVVALDLPTGVCADTGGLLGEVAAGQLTIAIGCLKPGHLLLPAAARSAGIELAPIGLPIAPDHPLRLLTPHRLAAPGIDANKYSRGKVVVIGGPMAGAAQLAALAAQRAGAGYVELVQDDGGSGPPHALVRRRWSDAVLVDPRVGAIVVGPGLADDADGAARVRAALATDRPVVLDAGALTILRDLGPVTLRDRAAPTVLTPHEGEFARLFGPVGTDRLAAVRAAAAGTGAIVLLKGAATIVAAPDGRARIAPLASPWLASAGTGDVLAGITATMLAQRAANGLDPLDAVAQAVWLHARAADHAGIGLIADDLIAHLPAALAELLRLP